MMKKERWQMTHRLTTKQKALVDTLVARGGSITDASHEIGLVSKQ